MPAVRSFLLSCNRRVRACLHVLHRLRAGDAMSRRSCWLAKLSLRAEPAWLACLCWALCSACMRILRRLCREEMCVIQSLIRYRVGGSSRGDRTRNDGFVSTVNLGRNERLRREDGFVASGLSRICSLRLVGQLGQGRGDHRLIRAYDRLIASSRSGACRSGQRGRGSRRVGGHARCGR